MFVVDTDILALLQRGDERVLAHFQEARWEVAATVISRMEILRGRFAAIRKASDGDQMLLARERLAQSEEHLRQVPILDVDAEVVKQFDRLRGKKALKKLSRFDLLLASIALANKATLATANSKHFKKVPGLKVENWS